MCHLFPLPSSLNEIESGWRSEEQIVKKMEEEEEEDSDSGDQVVRI